MTEELKPCPFCGKAPLIVCPDNSYGSAFITCGDLNDCPADVTVWVILGDGQTIEDAKRIWNTRPESEPVTVMREALEAIRDIEPEPFTGYPDDWKQQIKACAECQSYASHPIQLGICNEHRRPIWDERKHADCERARLGYRAMNIAREALARIGRS